MEEQKISDPIDRVELRPIKESVLDQLELDLATEGGTGTFQWFGFTSTRGLRRRFAETGLLTDEDGLLAVVADGKAVGRAGWFVSNWGRPGTASCWTIYIGLTEEYRGRGFGTRAQQLLVAYLFQNTRGERIQAYTDIENIAEQRALEKAGFLREGRLRAAQWRHGRWHDHYLYSIVRDDIQIPRGPAKDPNATVSRE